MNTLATTISGEGFGNKSTLESLDRLALILARIEADDRSYVEKKTQGLLDRADARMSEAFSKAGQKLVEVAGEAEALDENASLRDQTVNTLRKGAGLVAGLLDKNQGKKVVSALTSAGNDIRGKTWQPLIKLMNEVFGITDENRAIYELKNKVSSGIDGIRQDHRENLPVILAEQFSRKLSKQEWSRLHLGFGKTDIAALLQSRSFDEIRSLIGDDALLQKEIRSAEKGLHSRQLQKAQELAKFMVSGEIDTSNQNLLRNAYAVSRLLGEGKVKGAKSDAATEQAIDELITLYALDKLDAGTRQTLGDLSVTETKGGGLPGRLPLRHASGRGSQGNLQRDRQAQWLEGVHSAGSA